MRSHTGLVAADKVSDSFFMRRFFSVLAVLLALTFTARADNFVDFALNGTLPATYTRLRLQKLFGASAPSAVSPSLNLYKLRYRSLNDVGAPVVLSALVVLPQGGAPKGLILFNHGTTADRNASPSRFTGYVQEGVFASETELATLAFATGGYAVAMPDYLGLGDDKGPHPYPLGSINSRSAIDLILPARSLASRQNIAVGPRLFVAGYSEGGATAMWTVKNLESKAGAGYKVTAAAPMSGPYDLSDVTRQGLIAPIANLQDIAVRLYLLGYTLHYFQVRHGLKLTDYLTPSMAATVAAVFGKDLPDGTILQRLALTAILTGANQSLNRAITPRFKKAIQNLDTSDPIVRELRKSDCFDWSPRTPLLLTYLPNDTIVASANTLKAIKTMRARGVGANVVRDYAIRNKQLNHITAIGPSFLMARRFFDGGFKATSGPTSAKITP